MRKIMITGATGKLGNEVARNYISEKGADNVAVLARSAEKAADLATLGAEVRIGDYNNSASLETAFQGIDTLFFVSSGDINNRSAQHKNVIDAAKSAGVRYVIYTSFQRVNETSSSPIFAIAEAHFDAEKWLKESGLQYTFLRNALYMDLLPWFMGENVISSGTIYLPAEAGKTAFVLRSDLAAAGAKVLAETGHEGKIYELSGAQVWSYSDIANILSNITGKSIQYVSPTLEEYTQGLRAANVPEQVIYMFAGFSQAIAQGEFNHPNGQLEALLGRKATDAETFLTAVYGSK